LQGNFLALLAVTGEAPLARFSSTAALAPWVRTDGVALVALTRELSTQPQLLAPLDVTADGLYVPTACSWTGSLGPNQPGDAATTCNDWGSTANSGNGGEVEYSFHWFDEFQGSLTCEGEQPVLCFQN
jgi:hypothetical protein